MLLLGEAKRGIGGEALAGGGGLEESRRRDGGLARGIGESVALRLHDFTAINHGDGEAIDLLPLHLVEDEHVNLVRRDWLGCRRRLAVEGGSGSGEGSR